MPIALKMPHLPRIEAMTSEDVIDIYSTTRLWVDKAFTSGLMADGKLTEKDFQDVIAICEKYGIALPDEDSHFKHRP